MLPKFLQEQDIAVTMTLILGTMVALLGGVVTLQKPNTDNSVTSSFLPSPTEEPSKRAYEQFVMVYTPVWIFLFGIVVVFRLYEDFDEWSYLKVCGGLMLPLVLQPIVWPSAGFNSPDRHRPFLQRFSTKANVWIAVYSFMANHWFTHYFYSVLKADYSMPSHRLNNVPISMGFAIHFYFTTYHFFSNAILRKITTTYAPGIMRNVLFWGTVLTFSYFTAFMETLSISSYPYWSFEDRHMAYTVGSAFYAIYFIVSYPAFFYFDLHVDNPKQEPLTVWGAFIQGCGYCLLILNFLDFVRIYLDISLIISSQ